jgi:MFS family permease
MQRALGGQQRARVIVILACVLALNSADSSTVGAAATQLRSALHIGNTDIGLLVTVSSLVAAVASIPFGVLADRFNRTRILGAVIVLWGVAMLWSATAGSFGKLLIARLALGAVAAAAGPIVASLIGDYFDASERGRVYSYILSGELVGAGVGFAVTGDIAALSWRLAFVILAIPAFLLAWQVMRLPEPVRGGYSPLRADGDVAAAADPTVAEGPLTGGPLTGGPADGTGHGPTEAQRLAAERGIRPDETKVLGPHVDRLGLIDAARAVIRIRTNVVLIVAGSLGYFYLSGVETFGAEFVHQQYHIDQALANLLLLVVGGGALLGVLVAGGLSDRLLLHGYLNARITVAAVAALFATLLFVPAITTRSAVAAVPYLMLAAFMLSAQNPPIDAARLDIVPPLLWGRAEGVRTALRTFAQSLAPLTFGALSDHVFGGGRSGLQWTFGTTLLLMGAGAVILFRALRTYPQDVATAGASAAMSGAAGYGAGNSPPPPDPTPTTSSPPGATPAAWSPVAPPPQPPRSRVWPPASTWGEPPPPAETR